MIKRIGSLFFGMTLCGFGVVLTVKANLGTGPWDVLHLGLTHYIPLSFGVVSQLVGVGIIFISLLLGIKPGWGTIVNMYFVGVAIDFFMDCAWIPVPRHLFWQLVMVLAGVWAIGWGSYFYLSAAFGAGPRDSFMVGSITKTGWPVWKVRTVIETSVAAIGYLMGGPVGIGTIITAFTMGPAMQMAFTIMGKRVEDIRHAPLFPVRASGNPVEKQCKAHS